MPQDEPDPDEALDYILESAIFDSEASSGGEAGGGKEGEPEDEEEPLDETPGDYDPLYAADSTPSEPATTDGSKAGEEEEEEEEEPLDEPESPEDYEPLYGDAGSDDSDRLKSKPDAAQSAKPKEEQSNTPDDESSQGSDEDDEVVDEADDEEVDGQLDEPESPEDYESLYGDAAGGGKGDSSPSGPPDGPGSSKATGAPPGDAVDEADDVEDTGQLDEPESPEDYESLYGDAVGGGGKGASAPHEQPDAAPDTEVQGGDHDGGPDSGNRVDEADDVEDLGIEGPEGGAEGGSAPAPPAGEANSGFGRDVAAAEAAGGGGVAETGYTYGFKLLPPASLGYGDVVPCGAGAEPPADAFETIHPGLNMLLLLGVQKGGTTWMATALMQHPDLISATHGFTCACCRPAAHACRTCVYMAGLDLGGIDGLSGPAMSITLSFVVLIVRCKAPQFNEAAHL